MASSNPATVGTAAAAADQRSTRLILSIASGAFIASMAMNFWVPLLPLYMQELGAGGDAASLFWSAFASVSLGVGRIVSGPAWGMVSDRFGRKLMFVRALFFASATIAIVGAAQAPWHVAVAFAVQGLFSGFIPAATALMSVSVPEQRLGRGLSLLTGGQYLGTTIGPALGAALVLVLGFRGTILAGAALPMIAAAIVWFMVPRDAVAPRRMSSPRAGEEAPPAERALWRVLPRQFYIAVVIFFLLFAMTDVLRLLTPLALRQIAGPEHAAGLAGTAFSLSGLAAVFGVLVIGQRWVRVGRLRLTLLVGAACAGVGAALLSVTHAVVPFIGLFAGISLIHATLIPATNTLIATHVPRDRRGTGFGIASSAQALAMMAGPMVAAAVGGISLSLGFLATGAVFGAAALLVFLAVREPSPATD